MSRLKSGIASTKKLGSGLRFLAYPILKTRSCIFTTIRICPIIRRWSETLAQLPPKRFGAMVLSWFNILDKMVVGVQGSSWIQPLGNMMGREGKVVHSVHLLRLHPRYAMGKTLMALTITY